MSCKHFFITILALLFFASPVLGVKHSKPKPGHFSQKSTAQPVKNSNIIKVFGFRLANDAEKSRLVFDLDGTTSFQSAVLQNPDRIVLDIAKAQLTANLNPPALLNTPIKTVHAGQSGKTLHLVFDLKHATALKTFSLNKAGLNADKNGMRLVLDLASAVSANVSDNKILPVPQASISSPKIEVVSSANSISATKISKPEVVSSNSSLNRPSQTAVIINAKNSANATESEPTFTVVTFMPKDNNLVENKVVERGSVSTRPDSGEEAPKIVVKNTNNESTRTIITTPTDKPRDIIVVIDPGHGGKDSGANGIGGTHEKDVVLAIARDLQYLLNRKFGYKALLTRDGDYFIALRDRLHIAHIDKADLFIAIHADAYNNNYAKGASVFALSQRGATSEAARWLAEKENESELGQALTDKSMALKSLLIDLAQTATTDTSLKIGDNFLNELSEVTLLHHNGVEQAAFVVLKSPDIPSLLVETGFISNPEEEYRLHNSMYQQKIAYALAQGITDYFSAHPPPGTYVALARN